MNKLYFFLFLLFSIFSLPNLANFCRNFIPYNYDNQIWLTWQFSSIVGQLPYRDIFYPYGFLSYFKDINIIFSIIYYFMLPLLFTIIFIFMHKSFKNIIYSIISIIFFYLFIFKYTGFNNFERYGVLIVYSFVTGTVFYYFKKIPTYILLLLGITSGIIFPFFNDQGIYSLFIFIFFLILNLIQFWKKKNFILNFVKSLTVYIGGFLFALIPFFIFLKDHLLLNSFISSILELSDLEKLAKTPFFHGAATIDNLFTIGLIFVSIMYLCLKYINRSKFSLSNYLIISLILSLIIFEQKNMLRNIDSTISFVAILLLIFLFNEFRMYLLKKEVRFSKIYIVYLSICFVILSFIPFKQLSILGPIGNCETRFVINDDKFSNVKKELDINAGFNGRIFSFPGDTIFYIIFNQKPPFYPTSFEATSFTAQQKLINYIKSNKVNYVIYNYTNLAIQDSVPNIVRTPLLASYILTNYSVQKEIGEYIILSKDNDADFTKSEIIKQLPEFNRSLLDINLGVIPKSEGIYKLKYLSKEQMTLSKGSVSVINSYIQHNEVNSKNLFLFVKNINSNSDEQKISILSDNGVATSIAFKGCSKSNTCVINLARIPLFYKNRLIKKINFSNTFQVSLIKLDDNTSKYFW